ncbi:MAG: tetratricopeptide repeat protein [Phycisphaerales bacterium]|nr:tetratricopeptide repeat protein [Phycisphaerales bacterium]
MESLAQERNQRDNAEAMANALLGAVDSSLDQEFGDALVALEKAEKELDFVRDAQHYINLGDSHIHLNRWTDAIRCYEQAVAIDSVDSRSAETLRRMGRAYLKLDEHRRAVCTLKRAVALNDCDARIWTDLSFAYLESGRYEPSIEAAAIAIDLDPHFGGAHSVHALANHKLGRTSAWRADVENLRHGWPMIRVGLERYSIVFKPRKINSA